MERRTLIRIALSGLVACAALAPLAPAARAQTDPASIRARWEALSPDEQQRVLQSYERWKKLSLEDRALMKRRFDRLDGERARTRDALDDDDRRKLEKLRDAERHRELTRRAKAAVRERFEQLPPELRERRVQEAKESLKFRLERAVRERLARKVAAGELPRDAVEELRRAAQEKEGDPRARLELLRQFLVDHPDAFRLTPEQVERVKDARDAGAGLRVLERLRQRRATGDPPPPPPDDRPLPPRRRGI